MATRFAFGINILAAVGRVRAQCWKVEKENINPRLSKTLNKHVIFTRKSSLISIKIAYSST